MRGMYEEAKKAALRYQDIFGKGNFFLELQDHGIPEQKLVNQEQMRLSKDTGIELVATNDIHYTYAEDEKAHDILLCLQTGQNTHQGLNRPEGTEGALFGKQLAASKKAEGYRAVKGRWDMCTLPL